VWGVLEDKRVEAPIMPEKTYADFKEFVADHTDDFKEIERIKRDGHIHHCACRQVWGDGECECDLYEKGYNPYAIFNGKNDPV
jgi:hypothetical protein